MAVETSAEALGEALGAAARRLRSASMASLAAWDVTPSQMRAVRVLAAHEDGLRSSALAQHLRIAARSATEVVDALEAKGLVRRSPDPTDRRATLISLTSRGAALRAEVRRARGLASERLFDRLSESDRAQLARILQQLQEDRPDHR